MLDSIDIAATDRETALVLLGGFALSVDGSVVEVPAGSARLVALLALRRRPLTRISTAATLWPDSSETRAHGNLRSALWRLEKAAPNLVLRSGPSLSLAAHVAVDVRDLLELAQILESGGSLEHRTPPDPANPSELLPGWYDEWISVERQHVRMLTVRVLEGLSHWHRNAGRIRTAVDCARAATRWEPLRETASRALIAAHLEEGNLSEAVSEYRRFRDLMWTELGVEPSDHMARMLQAVGLAALIGRPTTTMGSHP